MIAETCFSEEKKGALKSMFGVFFDLYNLKIFSI